MTQASKDHHYPLSVLNELAEERGLVLDPSMTYETCDSGNEEYVQRATLTDPQSGSRCTIARSAFGSHWELTVHEPNPRGCSNESHVLNLFDWFQALVNEDRKNLTKAETPGH